MKRILSILLVCCALLPIACHRSAKTNSEEKLDPRLEQLYKELSKHPRVADNYIRLSDYFIGKGMLDSSLNYTLKAIRFDSLNASYYVRLSDIYLASQETDLCEDMLMKAIRVDSKAEEAYLKLAELHFLMKRYSESLDVLSRVLELNSYNPKAYFIRGWVMREQGDTAAAIRAYLKAADQNSEYFEAYEELAHLYHLRHNPLAIDQYRNALKVRPDDIQTMYNLAMYYQETGDFDNAISQYNNILSIDPVNKHVLHNIGWIFMTQREQYEEAVAFFTKAISQDTTFVEAVYNRGLAFEMMGNKSSARQDYSYALHLNQYYEPALEGLNRLDD